MNATHFLCLNIRKIQRNLFSAMDIPCTASPSLRLDASHIDHHIFDISLFCSDSELSKGRNALIFFPLFLLRCFKCRISFAFRLRDSVMSSTTTKRKEIYKYLAPWPLYSMNWSVRPDKRFRLALGSFIEEYNNKVQIISLDEESSEFSAKR